MHRVVSDYIPVESAGSSNIKVYVRARPLDDGVESSDFITVDPEDNRKIVIKDPEISTRRYGEVSFQFDTVFWTKVSQEEIFNSMCKAQVDHVLSGYNSCCFAYGQTGSGKTYTMFGSEGDIRGAIPRSMEYLFQTVSKKTQATEIALVCSFLEIYNDQIRDLGKAYLVAMGVESSNSRALYEKTSDIFEKLAGKRNNPYFAPAFHKGASFTSDVEKRPGLKEVQDEYNTMNYEIREDNEGNVFVKDLSLVPVTTIDEVMSLISTGLRVRATHETKMNAFSSRSHTVFTITVLQRDKMTGQSMTGMLNLVDLAGSERLKKSESQGVRLKEALHINTSLTALGKVIMSLDPSSEITHIPYRDSKLTRVLQNSLGGNSYTSVLAAIHPNPNYYEECLSTLQFANRCRNVRNNPRVNYVEDTEDKDKRIRKLMDEIGQLKSRLSLNSSSGPNLGILTGTGSNVHQDEKSRLNGIINLLRKLGVTASLGADNSLNVNGQRFTLDDLGMQNGGDISAESSGILESKHSKDSGGMSASHAGSEKMQKVMKELKDSNANYMAKAKERKAELEEHGKEIHKLSTELIKCQTTIKHKEFEINSLLEEKDRSLNELRAIFEARHAEEIQRLVKNNKDILSRKEDIINNIPKSLNVYTEMVRKDEKNRSNYELQLRHEFQSHIERLDKSRQEELEHIQKQYEFFLQEKDIALSGFVEQFNRYREKKVEQLRMAEQEIVRLYDYTEKIETILDNVEKGKYHVHQKQGAKGGRSTTGVMVMTDIPVRPTTASSNMTPVPPIPNLKTGATLLSKSFRGFGNETADGGDARFYGEMSENNKNVITQNDGNVTYGAVVLPQGTRPANPLKLNIHKVDLSLTKRIVEKHKERLANLDRMKEDAFQKSLFFAAQDTAAATGSIDATLQKQIRDLLEVQPKSARNASSSPKSRSTSARPLSSSPLNSKPHSRPTSARAIALHSPSNRFNQQPVEGTAMSSVFPSSNAKTIVKIDSKSVLVAELMAEIQELRVKQSNEMITTAKVVDELASNETIQFITRLETELEKLRSQLRDVSNQLLTAKVSNAALTRQLEKFSNNGQTIKTNTKMISSSVATNMTGLPAVSTSTHFLKN